MSKFLDDLNNAIKTGEFNSDAAKKINLITDLSQRIKPKDAEKLIEKRLNDAGTKTVTESEAALLNSEYEKKMQEIKENDLATEKKAIISTQIKTLEEIEEMVKLSIVDMLSFVEELEDKFSAEIDSENPDFGDLSLKMEHLKSKYSVILTNK